MIEYKVHLYLDSTYDVRDGVRVCVAGLTEGQAENIVKELKYLQEVHCGECESN